MGRKSKKNKRAVPLISYNSPKLQIAEQYRRIRTNIQFSSVDKEIKMIMVTSPEPADGKTTSATNLAIVLAQQEKRVLLVDADLRKPSIHYAFNISNIDGLTSVLTRRLTLEEAISPSHVTNLNILTSGAVPPNPSELLDSKAMETLMEELKKKFDYVIFDTPPVLAVTDPQVLANKCDGVVMVVASRKTHKEKALKAKELLEIVQSRILGVVLNRVENTKNDYYG